MNASLPPLLLAPIYVAKPWGGRRLETELGRADLPAGPIGESWEAVCTAQACSVVDGGPHDGRRLDEVLDAPLALLLKVLDASEDLSVQLHPDGSDGGPAKEEAWVALAPGGAVATGDVRAALARADGALPASGGWLTHLERRDLEAGAADGSRPPSLVHVPPRTVHCILGGSLLFEVQNPVDVTWRVDDFGRLGLDGRPRALDLEAAAPALAAGAPPAAALTDGGRRLDADRFGVVLLPPGRGDPAGARAAFFLAGGEVTWGAGDSFPVPPGRTVLLPPTAAALRSPGWVVTARAR